MEDDPEMEDDGERSLEVNDLLEVKLESKQFTGEIKSLFLAV